jgi:hypothetical protein
VAGRLLVAASVDQAVNTQRHPLAPGAGRPARLLLLRLLGAHRGVGEAGSARGGDGQQLYGSLQRDDAAQREQAGADPAERPLAVREPGRAWTP